MKRLARRSQPAQRRKVAAAGSVMAAAVLIALALPGGPAQAATSVRLATVEVTYTISFVATGGLTDGDTVTLTGPAGTTFPASGNNWVVADDTTGNDGGGLNFTSAGDQATGTVGFITVNPGDEVTIQAFGIGNTAATGSQHLRVSTSAESTPVNVPFTIDAKRAVGSVTVQVSSAAVQATGVTYTVGFSATDELWNSGSMITLTAPKGTTFPAEGTAHSAYFVNDDSGPGNCGPDPVSVSASGSTVTLGCGGAGTAPIPAGNRVTVSITGVRNAASAGSKTLTVTTSADPKTASGTYRLTSEAGATSVGAPMLTRSSSAAGATGTTWTVGFTATQGWYEGQVKLTAPAGTVFPGHANDYSAVNDTSGTSYGVSLAGTPAHSVTMEVDAAPDFSNGEFLAEPVIPGDHITLTISDVTNPSTSGPVSLSAGADPVAVSMPLSGSASTPGLTLTSTSAGAGEVEYTAGFTATVTQTVSTVNLAFPGGTKFQSSPAPCDVIRDDTTGKQSVCLAPTVSGTTVTLQTPSTFGQFTVSAGDYVTVQVYGVTNTSDSGAASVGLTTSDASGPVTLPGFTITAPEPVTTPGVILDSYAAGATEVSYAVSFIASEGLNTGGYANAAPSSVTITVPGASFPASSSLCDEIFDGSNGQGPLCPNTPIGSGGDTITLNDIGARIAPGDQVILFVYGAQNPAASGSTQLTVSTSGSNGPASTGIGLTAATKISDPALWLSSPAAHATGVTYTVGFTADNGLSGGNGGAGYSTVTVSAPAGTVFPDSGCTGVTVRDNTYWDGGCTATTGGGTNVLTISTPGVQPKDHVTVTIEGVTNAAAGSKTLHVSTSSDATPAAVGYHLN
jgi:hypothetical protein